MRRPIDLAAIITCVLAVGTPVRAAQAAEGHEFQISEVRLTVALVEDPDFPDLEPKLVAKALEHASSEFSQRFSVPPPRFDVVNEFSLSGFLGAYALPTDPHCRDLYAARYRGGGAEELAGQKPAALEFLKRWKLESLRGFIEEEKRSNIRTYEDIYRFYVKRYVSTVDGFKDLSTPAGTPLVEPRRSAKRSFVAWTCALLRQGDYDVVLTNAFILADLMTEPHPHAVFGKAKIGGIAARSPKREALGGEALLATTFGIDTRLPQFAELKGTPPTFDERAKILGAYLLAHEIAHAIFGIPDVFDHPKGCLMTSRPGATYRDGLQELEAHPEPCPRCRPYVLARSLYDRGAEAFENGEHLTAVRLLKRAAKKMPKHYHGGRKKRLGAILSLSAQSYEAMGKRKVAKRWAKIAAQLDPNNEETVMLYERLRAPVQVINATRTTSTATVSARNP